MDRNTRKMRNYGVERLLARLIKHKIITEDKYACYDFSFDKLKESATEQEIAEYINKQIANLPHSEWICFSVMETNYQNALYFANYLKEQHPQIKMVFGGPAATELQKEILEVHPFIDFVIFNTGEETFERLISNETPETIPNLIYRKNNEVIKNNEQFPQNKWDEVFVRDIHWNTTGKYVNNHFIVLGSLGCIAKCDFCVIIKKEPQLYERSTEKIIEEIKECITIAKERSKNNKDQEEKDEQNGQVYIQIMHQNFCHRIKELMQKLEQENILEHIGAIGFNSRADTFLVDKNQNDLLWCLNRHENTKIEIFIGIENYAQNVLNDIGKNIRAETNKKATEQLIHLREHHNFNFLLSFIGLSHKTTKEDLQQNTKALMEYFTKKEILHPVHYIFSSPLRLDIKLADTFGTPREKGLYPQSNFKRFRKQGNFAYPQDERVIQILEQYNEIIKNIPSFKERKEFYYQSQKEGRDPFQNPLRKRVFLWAELFIMDRILEDIPYDDILETIEEVNHSSAEVSNTLEYT